MRFTSVIVPVDLEDYGDRALHAARWLAAAGALPVELVTVSSPGMVESGDRWDLAQRARSLSSSGVDCTTAVLHSDDPAGAIVEHLRERPGALLVMATHARGVVAETLFGSVSEQVLTDYSGPMVLLGPHFDPQPLDTVPAVAPPLVAAVDEHPASEAVLDAAEWWTGTFAGAKPWVVEVLEPVSPGPAGGVEVVHAGRVRRLAAAMRDRGVPAQWEVLHGRHAASTILEFAGRMDAVVVALASERWTDPDHRHLLSVARAVTRASRHPVLVVPAARNACSAASERTAVELGS
jgi:nucleotide-binding universal stress UspA family protein